MPLLKTPGIVLKSRKWGEADRIVTFFTLKYGKVRGVARGARRMKNRFGSALEPFVCCDLNLFEKHGDSMYRVSQADIRQSFYTLRDSLEKIGAAARLANLAGAVTADGDAVPKIFHALLEGFYAIAESRDPSHSAALYEVEILRFAGYLPRLDRCTSCQSQQSGGAWFFSPRWGGTLCTLCARREPMACPAVSPACLAFFRQALKMDPALLPRLKPGPSIRQELREVIELYVECVAGRRMSSTYSVLAAETRPTYRSSRVSVAEGLRRRV
ncbi:MAG TPA: DNA repair protein RecO [Nitrospirales bacterium]|jgi:DNA repair protein RecO (recombination protein O)